MAVSLLGADPSFLYLSKPAGLPVFPAKSGDGAGCVLSQLLQDQPEQAAPAWPPGFEGGLLHRLDNWTTGLLVAARSVAALSDARGLFEGRRLLKRYRFLSDGQVPWDEHQVSHPLAHHPKDKRKMVWQRGRATRHRGQWREASTSFRRLSGALWEASMRTGVRHQIRLHAASVGLALSGDRLYGGGGSGRFHLHHCALDGWPEPLPPAPLPGDWPGPRGGEASG